MGKTKERRAWLYLNDADEQVLRRLEREYGGKLNEATILSVLARRRVAVAW
jgi:hypothetical protein